MKKAGIIGFGRFGRVLADLLSKKYKVRVYDIQKVAKKTKTFPSKTCHFGIEDKKSPTM